MTHKEKRIEIIVREQVGMVTGKFYAIDNVLPLDQGCDSVSMFTL